MGVGPDSPAPDSSGDPAKAFDSPKPDAQLINPKEEAFYSAALRRILRNLLVLTLLLTPLVAWRFGWIAAAGFASGGFVSWLNFRSLAQGAEGLADRIVNLQSKEHGGVVVSRFLLRYVLVGAVAYVIFMSSPVAFRGFLWGLTLPVGVMLVEAAYEALIAFGRGS